MKEGEAGSNAAVSDRHLLLDPGRVWGFSRVPVWLMGASELSAVATVPQWVVIFQFVEWLKHNPLNVNAQDEINDLMAGSEGAFYFPFICPVIYIYIKAGIIRSIISPTADIIPTESENMPDKIFIAVPTKKVFEARYSDRSNFQYRPQLSL